MEKTIYLSQNGNILGPFSQAEIYELESKGQLKTYFWMCRNAEEGWVPTQAPPALPPAYRKTRSNTDGKSLEKQSSQVPHILALCHNFRMVLSGAIRNGSPKGGTLTEVNPSSRSMPAFQAGAVVQLNLLHSETQQSETFRAQVVRAVKNGTDWEYELSWKEASQLLGA